MSWDKQIKVSKGAKIRNRYNQVQYLTQDTNGKVTNSQGLPIEQIVSEYDQEIPHIQIADKPMTPRRRDTQRSRDTRKTN